jgi:hypothetical protein
MTTVEPQAPRFTADATPEGLRVTLPPARSVPGMLFLAVWLTGWAFGEVQVTQQLLSPADGAPQLFLVAWLIGWTVGGAFALATLIWLAARSSPSAAAC